MSGTDTGLGKPYKSKKKRRNAIRFFVLALIFVLTIFSSYFSYNYVTENQKDKGKIQIPKIEVDKGASVDIPMGSTSTAIANILKDKGIIKYPRIFKLVSKINGYDGTYKAGTHLLSKELDYSQIMVILSNNPISTKIIIPEGLTYKQILDILNKNKLIDVQKFEQLISTEKFDFKFLQGLPKRERKLEGYLFPDTYEFDIKAGEKEIIKAMLKNFDTKFKPEFYNRAKELKMTTDQVITLASIVEREAKLPEERKLIAGVFYNRLKSKDNSLKKLQSCATIQYIYLNKQGIVKERITEKDTRIHDPYNTYDVEGLPPGPICSPGLDSIEAALYPEKTDYYYFVAKGDDGHQFSKTLKEHQAAMKKYGIN